jgi:hypothetical protein
MDIMVGGVPITNNGIPLTTEEFTQALMLQLGKQLGMHIDVTVKQAVRDELNKINQLLN